MKEKHQSNTNLKGLFNNMSNPFLVHIKCV